jgi:UrcA family protein
MNIQTESIHLHNLHKAARKMVFISLCVAAPMAVFAQSPSPPPASSAKVSLAQLDLATPEGMRVAHERLHAAARLACSHVENSLDLGRQPNYVKCVDASMAAAQPALEELARNSALVHVVVRN